MGRSFNPDYTRADRRPLFPGTLGLKFMRVLCTGRVGEDMRKADKNRKGAKNTKKKEFKKIFVNFVSWR
jgi:hypothetical protein